MPDINLDTLFIVGLILASLIGKFFKKKEPTDSSETSADSETSLESVLKDAWQKATQPIYLLPPILELQCPSEECSLIIAPDNIPPSR